MKRIVREQKPALLVIDDDKKLGELVARLAESKYLVEYVDNVKDAIDILMTRTIDVILSDVQMPDGGGPALYEALERSNRADICERMVFMTGGFLNTDVRRLFKENDSEPLRKPFTHEELHTFLATVLEGVGMIPRSVSEIDPTPRI